MNYSFKAAVMVAGLSLPLAAGAADTFLGDVTYPSPAGGANFSPIPGSFTDYLFLDFSLPSTLSASIGNLLVDAKPKALFDMASMTVSLWADTGVVGVVDELPTAMVAGFGGTGLYVSDSELLAPGDYYLKVDGMATGLIGGAYSYGVVAVPVPEAETWAMMAAGLGLLGLQLRRRTRGKRAVS